MGISPHDTTDLATDMVYILTSCTSCSLQKEVGLCFRVSSISVSQVHLHSIREDKGVETGFVDVKHQLCPSVCKGTAFYRILFLHTSRDSIANSLIPQCIAHVLGTEQRLALFITLFFTYPKAELAKQH